MKNTELTGEFRRKVLVKNDLDPDFPHEVKLFESTEWSGGCETCAFQYDLVILMVDNLEVARFWDLTGFQAIQEYLED